MNDPTFPAAVRDAQCLVIAGDIRESLDGVRALASHGRPAQLGYHFALELARQGAHVTLMGPKAAQWTAALPEVRPIEAGRYGAIQAALVLKSLPTSFDLIFQLARIPSIRPAHRAAHKIKAKERGEPLLLKVVPNVELLETLHAFGPTFGYATPQGDYEGSGTWSRYLTAFQESTPSQVPGAYGLLAALPSLAGAHAIVTSGPTVEPLTSGRDVLTNFSSGRQGQAIAWALAQAGARVSLITGPTVLEPPSHPGIKVLPVQSAAEMHAKAHASLPAEAFVGVAAVADFAASTLLEKPITSPTEIILTPTVDILSSIGNSPQRPRVVVGFAAETQALETYARDKLVRKHADVIFANGVSGARPSGDSSLNQVTEISALEILHHPLEPNAEVGRRVVKAIARRLGTIPV